MNEHNGNSDAGKIEEIEFEGPITGMKLKALGEEQVIETGLHKDLWLSAQKEEESLDDIARKAEQHADYLANESLRKDFIERIKKTYSNWDSSLNGAELNPAVAKRHLYEAARLGISCKKLDSMAPFVRQRHVELIDSMSNETILRGRYGLPCLMDTSACSLRTLNILTEVVASFAHNTRISGVSAIIKTIFEPGLEERIRRKDIDLEYLSGLWLEEMARHKDELPKPYCNLRLKVTDKGMIMVKTKEQLKLPERPSERKRVLGLGEWDCYKDWETACGKKDADSKEYHGHLNYVVFEDGNGYFLNRYVKAIVVGDKKK